MGGAYGHLMHLHEDLDLTFDDLRAVIAAASTGTLERATEKTDGMNLVFTVDTSTGNVKVARSAGDIKRGGLDAQALAGRFNGRSGDVVTAFQAGFEVLRLGMQSMPPTLLREAFGPRGDVWYSAEVIDTRCPNVIRYDVSCVVMHAHGSFRLVDGKVDQRVETPGLDPLFARLAPGGDLRAPTYVSPCLSSRAAVDIDRCLDVIMKASGASGDVTLREFAAGELRRRHHGSSLPAEVVDVLVDRLVGAPGAPNLAQIRRVAGPALKAQVDDFIAHEDAALVDALASVEHLVYRLGVELLDGTRSTMVDDHDAEVQRLRVEVSRAMADVGHERVLHRHVSRLRDAEVTSSVEGVVFRHLGKAYKLTGLFAPMNQVLGFRRYGRGAPA